MAQHDNYRQAHTPPGARTALLVAVGTSPGGILRILRSLLARTPGIERLSAIAIDSDNTRVFPNIPAPLEENGTVLDWGPNAFVHVPPPREEVLRSIRAGEIHGFDHVSPRVMEAVNGDGVGVGGLVPLGNAVALLYEDKIRGAVRHAINAATAHRTELNDPNDAQLLVLEVAGVFGGTWGALEPVREIVRSQARAMGVSVVFQRTVMFPGQHPSKDMEASKANAAAWTREFAARASGRYLALDRLGDKPTLGETHLGPAWIISDMNAAPGTSSTLPSTSALFSLVAHWLYLWLATPLGSRLEQALVDFRDDARQTDRYGEQRVARSFGLASITLNRDRVQRFAATRLTRNALTALLGPSNERDVDEDVWTFNRTNRLLEGEGNSQISEAIRSMGVGGQGGVDRLTRFRNLLDQGLEELEDGMALLREGPAVVQAVVAQCAGDAARFEAARDAKIAATRTAIREAIDHWLWDPTRGALHVHDWLETQQRVFGAIVEAAAEDRQRLAEHTEDLQTRLRELEAGAVAHFLAMNRLRRWFNRKHIETVAREYVRLQKHYQIARKEDQVRAEAIAATRSLEDAFESHETDAATLVEELSSAMDAAEGEEQRIRQWDGTLINPNGVQLDDDLEGYYRRVIRHGEDGEADSPTQDDERRAADGLLGQLRDQIDLMVDGAEAGRIGARLTEVARSRVDGRVSVLHVEDELFRRHPAGSEALKSFLRERDREAHERLTLDGNADVDGPMHVLRFVVADPRRGAEIVNLLNQSAYTRGQASGNATYELVPLADAERITLIQVRLSFPPSRIGLHESCREAYRRLDNELEYERNHTDLVGRFLPEPGARAEAHDAEVALAKAYVLARIPLDDEPGPPLVMVADPDRPLELRHWAGQRVPLGVDLDAEDHPLRSYDVRVEMATRFYAAWCLHGPDILAARLSELDDARPAEAAENDLAATVAPLVTDSALEEVGAELQWYLRNTNPKACLWSRRSR